MKSASAEVLLMLAVCVIAFGFDRGWFTVSSHTSAAPTNSAKEKTTGRTGEVTEEAKELEKQITGRLRIGSSSSQ